MKWRAVAVSLGSILAVLAGSHLLGESPVDFERDVQPILQEKCLSCHTPDAPQSGLVMESVEAMLKGARKPGPRSWPETAPAVPWSATCGANSNPRCRWEATRCRKPRSP